MRAGLAAGLAILALAGAARAAGPGSARVDELVTHPRGEAIGVVPRRADSLPAGDPFRAGWERLRDGRPGAWSAYVDERTGMPALARPSGLRWFEAGARAASDPAALEAAVRGFLERNESWLGDWRGGFEVDRAASGSVRPGHEQVVLRQVVDGVRVDNARLDLHVIDGVLAMFGATNWAEVRVSGVPTLSAADALDVLAAYAGSRFDALTVVAPPALVLRALEAGASGDGPTTWAGPRGLGLEHALLWRFRLAGTDGVSVWVAEIDAHRGAVHAFYDDTDSAAVRGGVFPFSNDGDCADGGCEVARMPLPFVEATEDGQPAAATDAFGNAECLDPVAQLTTAISGPYVLVQDACGLADEHGTCDEGIDLGRKDGENCRVAPGDSAGNTAAARTAYYHVNRAAEAARFYAPANAWLQDTVVVNVNDPLSCNAFWNGEIVMRGAGDGCGNMGEIRGILVHEWGHGHDHNDGGGSDSPSEAYADVMALFAGRDSCIARGWYDDGRTCEGWGNACVTCTGVRDLDWAAREWGVPSTIPGFVGPQCPQSIGGSPCNRQSHCEGHVVGETMYDLATRDLPASGLDPATSWQVAERLWYASRQGSGGNMYFCIFPNVYSCGATALQQRLLAADDDDGDLTNGTPHAGAIFAAFDRHGLACGAVDDPENTSTSSCVAPAAPVPSAQETTGGTELTWSPVAGATAYRVYGNEIGCDRQQTPLAEVPSGQTSYLHAGTDPDLPRTYRVEAVGAGPGCFGPVSACVEPYSGARLQVASWRLVESGTVNGIPDPGETVVLPVTALNSGVDAATAAEGTLVFSDPGQGTVVDGNATWAGPPAAGTAETDAPHFEVTLADTVACGDVVAFDVTLSAANAATVGERIAMRLGEASRDFTQATDLVVPSEPAGPFASTLTIDDAWTLADLDVSVKVLQPDEADLIVELVSPQGTVVRLHDRSELGFGIDERYDATRQPDGPGTMADFAGEPLDGAWTLTVEDAGDASVSESTLQEWTLHATIVEGFDCVPAVCAEPPLDVAPALTVERVADGAAFDIAFSWSDVPGAAGYRVRQSSTPAFDAGVVELAETGAGETGLVIPEPATPDLLFFVVRGVNGCGVEGP